MSEAIRAISELQRLMDFLVAYSRWTDSNARYANQDLSMTRGLGGEAPPSITSSAPVVVIIS